MLCQTLAPAKHTKFDWRSVGEQMRQEGYVLPADESYGPTPYDVDLSYISPRFWTQGQFGLLRSSLALYTAEHPEDFQYMRFPPPKTIEELLTRGELTFRRNPANMANVNLVVDKEGEHFDGIIGLTCCDPVHLTDVHGDRILQLSQQVWLCDRDNLPAVSQLPHRFAAGSRSKES